MKMPGLDETAGVPDRSRRRRAELARSVRSLEVDPVEVGDLEFSPRAGLQGGGPSQNLVVVRKYRPGTRVIAFGVAALSSRLTARPALVEFDDP